MAGLNKNIKAGLWYTASNFINKGIAYLSTPIFTRLLSKEEFGEFSNFTSWASLLLVVTSLDLYSSINRAYFDYKNDFDEYMSTISGISVSFTALCYIIMYFFKDTVTEWLKMDFKYVNMLFLYLLFYPATNFFMTQQRIMGKYKLFSAVSIGSSVFSMLLSIITVLTFSDKLWGRVVGYIIPIVMLNVVIYGFLFSKGKKIVWEKTRYALLISIPLIPHHISNNVLNSSDRIMINQYCGASDTALYSLAYSCSTLVTLLHTSINQAYIPWLYKKLNEDNLEGISKQGERLLLVFLGLVLGILLLAPEMVYVFGGEKYMVAVTVMPVVMLGCCFQYVYTLYVNLEFYCKKTISVSIGTFIAAGVNVGLNILLIPIYGYMAAAFTTLISYILLYAIHFGATRKLEYRNVYNNKKILSIMSLYTLLSLGISCVYKFSWARYLIVGLYGMGFAAFLYRYQKKSTHRI